MKFIRRATKTSQELEPVTTFAELSERVTASNGEVKGTLFLHEELDETQLTEGFMPGVYKKEIIDINSGETGIRFISDKGASIAVSSLLVEQDFPVDAVVAYVRAPIQ